MKLGWLWLSILKTQASPSPMSMTPAFSPGPWITQGALVGSVRRWRREDLYEQCSFHIAETMPSSVSVGSRPMRSRKRRYSSSLSPCSLTSSGVMGTSFAIIGGSVGADAAAIAAVFRDGNAGPDRQTFPTRLRRPGRERAVSAQTWLARGSLGTARPSLGGDGGER